MSEQFGRSSVGTLRIPRSTVIYTRSAYVHITARTWPLNAVFVARGGWVPTRSVSSSEDSESGLEGIIKVDQPDRGLAKDYNPACIARDNKYSRDREARKMCTTLCAEIFKGIAGFNMRGSSARNTIAVGVRVLGLMTD
ncbi:hypothetical protein K438DRAFT_1771200 [Mycena galopus ATCC 62051]|nr:hypothetical protein K438DRAFT_1771200 [Mycena galopus ATCC 62051]